MTRTLITAIFLTLFSHPVTAETVLMVCDAKKTKADYAKDGKVYRKLETGLIKSKIYFRDKIKWQLWCDVDYFKSNSSKTSEFLESEYELGDAAGVCTRKWKKYAKDDPTKVAFDTDYSYVDFYRLIYETKTYRKINENSETITDHKSDCKLIQNLTNDQ